MDAAAILSRRRPLNVASVRLNAVIDALPLVLVLIGAVLLRVWRINEVGYNSDEAVYVGQAAALAGISEVKELFPAFRAHPLLVHTLVSFLLLFTTDDLYPRLFSAAFGGATVLLTYKLGKDLYGRQAGLIAALMLALMPYHVIVTRQMLLDGPMTFFATASLYCLAKLGQTKHRRWLFMTSLCLGLSFLAKETAVVLVGAVYVFLALSPLIVLRLRDVLISLGVFVMTILPFPAAMFLAGKAEGGTSFLAWQLLRRPNHSWDFYLANVPGAIGPLVILVAIAGFLLFRRHGTWREFLLLTWIVVPLAFFQFWQVKGFQYLLPLAPPLAILAGRTFSMLRVDGRLFANPTVRDRVVLASLIIVASSLAFGSYTRISGSSTYRGLAGSGGVPAGRETGHWIAENAPLGSTIMTIGPSMANIIQWYGHRKALGLAVSPNPLRRNPSYQPIINPDASLRYGDINYVVWDAFSARRSPHFGAKILSYADRYHGRIVHSESALWTSSDGKKEMPVIVVFEVRP